MVDAMCIVTNIKNIKGINTMINTNTVQETVESYIDTTDRITIMPCRLNKLSALFEVIKRVDDEEALAELYAHANEVDKGLFEGILKSVFKKDVDEIEHIKNTVGMSQCSIDDDLKMELQQLIEENRMLNVGLSLGPRGAVKFDSNTFVMYLLQVATLINNEGRIQIYSHTKGTYDDLDEELVGKITKYLLNRAMKNCWKSSYERDINAGLVRTVPSVAQSRQGYELVCLQNGIYDLKNQVLLPHSPNYILPNQVPITYDSEAKCPKFLQFIDDITCNDTSLARNLQEIAGNTLIDNAKAERAVYLYGCGANGKSVYAEVLTCLLGRENVTSIPLSKFGMQFGVETIVGKMANISSENELSSSVGTELLKGIISGDTIDIQRKHKTSINYRATCKLIFLVNTLPDTLDNTHGYYRKLRLIPFERVFKPSEQDVDLKEKLIGELPGILNWALEGAHRLITNGYKFTPSQAIDNVLKSYTAQQNPVREFFEEGLIYQPGARTPRKTILNTYKNWLEENCIAGKGTESPQKFWKALDNIAKLQSNVKLEYPQIKGSYHLKDYVINPNFVHYEMTQQQADRMFEFIA